MTKIAFATIALIASSALCTPAMAQDMTSGNNANGPRSTYNGGDHADDGQASDRGEYCRATKNRYICNYSGRGFAP